jgi:hypothetical protein
MSTEDSHAFFKLGIAPRFAAVLTGRPSPTTVPARRLKI